MHMIFDRSLGDPQTAADAGVRAALSHQREDLAFAGGEQLEWIVDPLSGDELLHETRVDDRAPSAHALQRLEELVDIGHATLQQVTAAAPAREQRHRVCNLDVRREDEDRYFRELLADYACRLEAFRRTGRRHPDVDDDEIGPVLANEAQQLRPVARLTHKLVSGPLEQARKPLPQEDIVVRDDYAPAARRASFACRHGCSISVNCSTRQA